jgi:hypothetical protein
VASLIQDPLFEYPDDLPTQLSEEELREIIRTDLLSHLRAIGLNGHGPSTPLPDNKERIRLSHAVQRQQVLARERPFLERYGHELLRKHFADGCEVEPEKIDPVLSIVRAETEDAAVFRLATLLWSVPVSNGYGRRIRYLVRDRNNGKLIGLFGLTDPVYNLRRRDNWIGWTVQDRRQRLVNLMDAHVAGAIPPYNRLLCGKLVASLMTSTEVCQAFAEKYDATTGIISGQQKHAQLVLLTVTSALGRSAMYNRLRLPGLVNFESVGMTEGWGHFQIPDHVFRYMRALLTLQGHRYASGHKFGMGPNWRIRVTREALSQVDLSENLLRHGITREIFVSPLASNWREFLRGQTPTCTIDRPSATRIARAGLDRWVLPRAQRDPSYACWTREQTWHALSTPTSYQEQ